MKGPAPTPPIERFENLYIPEPNSGCWLWLGTCNNHGYGMFGVGSKTDGTNKKTLAHRFSYEAHIGPIREGLIIDHLCRNKSCVNPEHLEPVTYSENGIRGFRVSPKFQPRKTYCCRGHEFTSDNTWTATNGKRRCRACDRERMHNLYLARKALRAV